MFRGVIFVFLLGWAIWFWLDKSPALMDSLPRQQDDLISNFQIAFNILKQGHFHPAFIFIWRSHYILLSLLGGLLVSMGWQSISSVLSRRRLRKLYVPKRRSGADDGEGTE
ncbi:MAG: hypothetical protein WBN08_17555 [Thiogranum sp.]